MKKVSAIIVNWNGKDILSKCLQSLLKQEYENLEIWVSDNGSEDGSPRMLKELDPSVRLVANGENLGLVQPKTERWEKRKGTIFCF